MHRAQPETITITSSRPSTREGQLHPPSQQPLLQPPPPPPLAHSRSASNILPAGSSNTNPLADVHVKVLKDRKPAFTRKAASFSFTRRRGSSGSSLNAFAAKLNSGTNVVTDAAAPPALPDYALAAAAKITPRDRDLDGFKIPNSPERRGRLLTRQTTASSLPPMQATSTPVQGSNGGSFWQANDIAIGHQQIMDLAYKRMSILEYLRKAHEGQVNWFNTYLFDKSSLQRMPCFDPRKLARKATNYLFLGLSLPVILELHSATILEFLRNLLTLLSEFESFQQLRNDSSASLSRARLPNMFRRPGGRSRRMTSTTDVAPDEPMASPSISGVIGSLGAPGGVASVPTPSVMNFAASESDLLPGEEYQYLLTPSLPFEPDYFETFATLCDVLIDVYSTFLQLVPTPRECSPILAETFIKADAKVRKVLVQGTIKEFEDMTRAAIKTEIASVGKVVLSGLM